MPKIYVPERASAVLDDNGHMKGPRVNPRREVAVSQRLSARTIWNVWKRSEKECHAGSDYNTCEKGINTNVTNLAIILGIAIPVVVATFVLLYLHRRNVKKLRQEDAQDPHRGLDFGMGDSSGKGKRKSFFGVGEKSHHRSNQLSMDMNLSSPYLLPPTGQQPHAPAHKLARTFSIDQDPYRTVAQYANSDAASTKSFRPSREASLNYGTKLRSASGSMRNPPSRSDSMPNALSIPDSSNSDPFETPTSPEATHRWQSPRDVKEPIRPMDPVIPELGTVGSSEKGASGLNMPDIQQPPRAPSQESVYKMPSPPHENNKSMLPELPAVLDVGKIRNAYSNAGESVPHPQKSHLPGPGLEVDVPKIYSLDEYGTAGGDPGHVSSQHGHGHRPSQSSEYPEEQQFQQGLGVPQQQAKRLSVGFRPLPPDEVMESEDPEYRANRIRSFYKEYFDDTEPAPPLPQMPEQMADRYQVPEYYEDCDSSYLGEAAYYDAETNAFVMPYSQPVTRRAMTPPPAGRSRGGPGGPGPRGPPRGGPRGPGSLSGMSLPGGPGRPRAGSAFGPRPGSSASAGPRGRPVKKNLPPPAALPTLPTPSKLKDDSFAIFNAAEFAPPESIRDQATGRSQSPLGERRPYQPKVPVASPLVTAFDELSALPSPYVLRKSSTFTNLDFAPPKKFKDADTTSDAGSIRSNRSGISAVQHDAIRRGAGRVSRLPGDTVFSSAALGDTLKPQWGMRP